MAKNMLKAGFDADSICRATGLLADEYENEELVVLQRHKDGQDMKKWRIAQGHTQEELAKELGITRTQVHNYEQGKCVFLGETACEVSGILPVDADDLIREPTEKDYYEDEEADGELLSSTREFKRIDNQESRDELNTLTCLLLSRGKKNNLFCLRGIMSKLEKLGLTTQEVLKLRNKLGDTPVIYAVKQGEVDIVRFPLLQSADPKAVNDSLQSPIDIAIERGRVDMIKAITEMIPHLLEHKRIDNNESLEIYYWAVKTKEDNELQCNEDQER